MDKFSEATPITRWVHWGLLAGVIASASLLVCGLAIVLWKDEPRPLDTSISLWHVIHKALHGDGVGLVELGLMILMLTPVFRVLILAWAWFIARKWALFAIAVTVLVLLITSFLLGTT